MRHTTYISRRHTLLSLIGAGVLAAAGVGAHAQPSGTILTVIPSEGGEPVHFTDADLAALPNTGFGTSTIWTEGTIEFSGPPLSVILEAAGIGPDVTELRLTALNEYAVEMDVSRIEDEAPIVANRMDGQPFSVRDKGPLWLVFPYDSAPRFRSESAYALSVWQLRTIEAL